ncbi:MAG: ATP-binding cassette domain-containing protein [Geminicoccaceae bacterium]
MAALSSPVIEARDLRKLYGELEAVKGVNFTVQAGTCTGLLGPNGAGKTTMMRMIMGLTRPSGGDLSVFGEPARTLVRDSQRRIGLVPQEDNLDPDLSVANNLWVYGRYFGLSAPALAERVPALLAFVALSEKADAPVMQLSGGMKRRLIIARALIGDPELVILDEPTTGLDPQSRVLVWKKLLALREQGKTLLLTTHYMDEAQRLCDWIIVVDGGQILDEGSPQQLIRSHVKRSTFELTKPVPEAVWINGEDHEDVGDAIYVYTDDDGFAERLPPETIVYHRPSNLEDVFLRLTGRTLRDG